MPDQLQKIDLIDLVRGGSNNTAAVSKIAGAVIDMSQYSYEEQTCGKQRKIEWGGIRHNCTGPKKCDWTNKNLPDEIIKYTCSPRSKSLSLNIE
jgi:hypothetical protein